MLYNSRAKLEARCRYAAMLVADGEDLKTREHGREVERAICQWDIVQMRDDRAMTLRRLPTLVQPLTQSTLTRIDQTIDRWHT